MTSTNQVLNFHTPQTIAIIPAQFREVTFEGTLSPSFQNSYQKHKNGSFCCSCGKGIKGAGIYLLVMCGLTLILGIISTMTSLSKIDEYKYLKAQVSAQIILQDAIYEQAKQDNIFRFDKFWYQFEDFENKIIITDIVIPILYIIFIIAEIALYYSILNKETKSGIIRALLIIINFYIFIN